MPALVPAKLALTAEGTPYSEAYGDVYHSAEGGREQARHVFLGGNGLPERWRGRRAFTIVETGFGMGLNFLATWSAWRDDARRCERLHFVSLEKHPFELHDLADLHARHPEFAPLAAALHAQWPLLLPGCHRLSFDDRVTLTLYFADAEVALGQMRLAADAIYLDGFAPAKNPEMWTRAVMKRLARLAAPEATAATWSVAAEVREALEAAGFGVEKRAGFARKREMLCARYAPRTRAAPLSAPRERRAIVIGAGLAGASVCERLHARDWEVTLVERHHAPALEASGNHAGVFHPIVTRDDSPLARLTRAGYLYGVARWNALEASGQALEWDRCGVLQLARNAKEDAAQRSAIAALSPPAQYAEYATRDEASSHAGVPVAAGGIWFPGAGWLRPASLARAALGACGASLETRYGRRAAALERAGERWIVRDAEGEPIAAAPVVVLANAGEPLELAPSRYLRLRRVRGQISHVPAGEIEPPRAVVLRGGLVLPPVDGLCVVGATYDFDDDDPESRTEGHAGNLERLARILPGAARGIDPVDLAGRVGFRSVAPDRLPLVGALADDEGSTSATIARLPGLYGAFAYASRGIVWASLAAELLASQIEGEPLPVEGALADALDPGRFAQRSMRRAKE
jgi:tRNA 5-methylaminomethyl-2-thiouridine biosynthesis bifunctional protein